MTEQDKLNERLWVYRYVALFGFANLLVGGLIGLLSDRGLPLVAMLAGAMIWAWFGCAATSVKRRLTEPRGHGE